MNMNKRDYFRGMICFSIIAISICSFFETPDGEVLFYKFLGLFGISSGIKIGTGTTLYPYIMILLIIDIICIRKVLKYWWHYGQRFNKYNILLRGFPIFMITIIFFIASNIEGMYYNVKANHGGLASIVYYNNSYSDPFSYYVSGNKIIYSYDLNLHNLSDEVQEFQIKIINEFNDNDNIPSEFLIKDDDGQPKTFMLFPSQRLNLNDEYTEITTTQHSVSSAKFSSVKIVLINDIEQHQPKLITKQP